uniref:Uncharacterized protein n=1 Tax=Setaria viridis TaxID=4556 RepID=A0A4U6VKD7_SETVI|nr:hypothetical protein SEVIR_3G343466v2 [Setaria viridis]
MAVRRADPATSAAPSPPSDHSFHGDPVCHDESTMGNLNPTRVSTTMDLQMWRRRRLPSVRASTARWWPGDNLGIALWPCMNPPATLSLHDGSALLSRGIHLERLAGDGVGSPAAGHGETPTRSYRPHLILLILFISSDLVAW